MTLTELEKISLKNPILFYDGMCKFCSGFVQFIIAHDHEMKFRFRPLQADLESLKSKGLSFINDYETVIVIKNKNIYTKSDVTFLIIDEIGGRWKFLKFFKYIPKSIRDRIYDLIAKNRYFLFGKRAHCHVPSDQDRRRFL